MTEDEAHAWVDRRFGPTAHDRIAKFVALMLVENAQQNLVSTSTLPFIWARHVVDSAQLIAHAPSSCTHWIDVGTGAGFPGMIVALVMDCSTTLIEPRRRRADFLAHAAAELGATNVAIISSKVEVARAGLGTIISARAVAPIGELFRATAHLADLSTRYILPRGRHCATEVENVHAQWHGVFHVEQSLTDPQSGILLAERVRHR